MENIEDVLASNVRRLRKEKGITQEALAEGAGLSLFSIQAIESRRSWPSIETISRIASFLGVSTSKLYQAETQKLSNEEVLNKFAENMGYALIKKN